ncbi:hypothetical protein JMN32_08840 [Fulvivirga sp. 29W222]|uniref:Uncharacterized protein n=1 Tax=Fulvivirga marina TaxID=2494733 RepID=A0A937FX98_9BACT|nr:hypothetical protein [Fulvivirga marina]MBL6446412.1 hypothetical protein [Fulvivirga marina]
MVEINHEIEEALSKNFSDIVFEEMSDEIESPLNQPVKEKNIAKIEQEAPDETEPEDDEEKGKIQEREMWDYDAPEQEINEDYEDTPEDDAVDEAFELPSASAKQVADTFLGITDNLMAVGGGFFIKIKKHKEFYEFDEIIQVIEEQNERNVKRLSLDEEDKTLLRPLLIAIVKKKSTKLTPEQQLLGAALSILMKKGQAVMEMRMENEMLIERILSIIKEEKDHQQKDNNTETENEDSREKMESPVIEVMDDDEMMEAEYEK